MVNVAARPKGGLQPFLADNKLLAVKEFRAARNGGCTHLGAPTHCGHGLLVRPLARRTGVLQVLHLPLALQPQQFRAAPFLGTFIHLAPELEEVVGR